MLPEKFEKNFLILELPYNIGICTNIAHANSLHPPSTKSIIEQTRHHIPCRQSSAVLVIQFDTQYTIETKHSTDDDTYQVKTGARRRRR